MSAPSSPAPVAAGTKKRAARPRVTYMLHAPETFVPLGKFQSSDARYAALKAASRGHTDILLRQTNTRIISQYEGKVQTLDQPHVTVRQGREITYSKKHCVKFVKKFPFEGKIISEDAPLNPKAPEPTEA
jgi:hypothetical protein